MDVSRCIIFIFLSESLTYELILVTEDSKKNDALHQLCFRYVYPAVNLCMDGLLFQTIKKDNDENYRRLLEGVTGNIILSGIL